MLAAHGLNETSTVVDLGSGTGRFALAAARRFGQVTAVDISPAMLQLLRERAAAAAVTNVACVQAGFLSYQHAGSPADAVYTRNALQSASRLLEGGRAGPHQHDAAVRRCASPTRSHL